MATWTCATHGPVPAGEIRHLDHDSPTGQERHECGSSAGLDWTTDPKEHEMTTTTETDQPTDIHTAFGLSYSNYLVLPRTLLQSMPLDWQHQFTALLERYNNAFAHVEQAETYQVAAGRHFYIDDMTDAQLNAAGVTWTGDEDEDGEGDREYFDREGNSLDRGVANVFVASKDPVPHYNRGRTRVEPRLS